jgi:hypothetical protein
MNSRNTSDGLNKRPHQKRRFLTAEQKFPIYLEAQANDQPGGELLRREGLSSPDLARIRQQVKAGALQRLHAKPGQKPNQVDGEAGAALKHERQEKARALVDLTVELAILRKNPPGGSWGR